MFVRFITTFVNEKGEAEHGIFQAMKYLFDDGRMTHYDDRIADDLFEWFADYLDKPDTLKKKNRDGLHWYKDSATQHIAKMYEMKYLLERYDIPVKVIMREDPGRILYEDEYQVCALPHNKEFSAVR